MHLSSSMPFFSFVLSDSASNALGHFHVQKEYIKRTPRFRYTFWIFLYLSTYTCSLLRVNKHSDKTYDDMNERDYTREMQWFRLRIWQMSYLSIINIYIYSNYCKIKFLLT